MNAPVPGFFLPRRALDAVLPMHMVLSDDGIIQHAAPTLLKISPLDDLVGTGFLDVFEIVRPKKLAGAKDLSSLLGTRLRVNFTTSEQDNLRATINALGPGCGYLVNLSFGISVVSAVAKHDLTSADFGANDPTIEMLYLVEANGAAMQEARSLIRRLQVARSHAEDVSFTDGLTGLRNRRALEAEVAQYLRDDTSFGLLLVDLDFFKAVNDNHGHAAGDLVLEKTALRLLKSSRDEDYISRTGGDEFVILVKEETRKDILLKIAERLIREIENPVQSEDLTFHISASIGVSVTTDYDAPSLEEMMLDADRALYTAKRDGKSRAVLGEPKQLCPPKDG